MEDKLNRLQKWYTKCAAISSDAFFDGQIEVICSVERARQLLTYQQQNIVKGEFQKSPFSTLLGSDWLGYLDGSEHLERRREVGRILRDVYDAIDWNSYIASLTAELNGQLDLYGHVANLFETLAWFSSHQLGIALFGSRFTEKYNERVRQTWQLMNLLAEQDVGAPVRPAGDFDYLASSLRQDLYALHSHGELRTQNNSNVSLDNLVGIIFAAQDTSASVVTSAVCIASNGGVLHLADHDFNDLIVESFYFCPPAPVIYRQINDQKVVISPYVLRDYGNASIDVGNVRKLEQFFVFGAGTHRCLGDRFALAEIVAMMKAIDALPPVCVDTGSFPQLEAQIVLRPKGSIKLIKA